MALPTFPGARIQLDWLYVAQTIVQRWIKSSLLMASGVYSYQDHRNLSF